MQHLYTIVCRRISIVIVSGRIWLRVYGYVAALKKALHLIKPAFQVLYLLLPVDKPSAVFSGISRATHRSCGPADLATRVAGEEPAGWHRMCEASQLEQGESLSHRTYFECIVQYLMMKWHHAAHYMYFAYFASLTLRKPKGSS